MFVCVLIVVVVCVRVCVCVCVCVQRRKVQARVCSKVLRSLRALTARNRSLPRRCERVQACAIGVPKTDVWSVHRQWRAGILRTIARTRYDRVRGTRLTEHLARSLSYYCSNLPCSLLLPVYSPGIHVMAAGGAASAEATH